MIRSNASAGDIFAAGYAINPALLDRVRPAIETVKPARSHLDRLRIGERFDGRIHMRAAVREKLRQTGDIDPSPRTARADAAFCIRTAERSRRHSRITHDVVRKAA